MEEANPAREEASPSQPMQPEAPVMPDAPGTPDASAPSPAAPEVAGAPGDVAATPSPYAGYPAYPSVPSQPMYPPTYSGPPSMPMYPPYSGPPSAPMYPGYAGSPSTPLYPAYPGPPSAPYPGYPPNPATTYPPYPGVPSMPLTPTYSGYPGYAGMPGGQLAPASVPLPPAERSASRKHLLVQLVPALLLAATGLVVAVALVLGIVLNGGDWASGALAGGIAALILAGACLAGTLVRVALGRRSRQAVLLGLAAALVVGVLGGTGLVLPNPLHRAQARSLESSGDWSGAIHQYELAGEHAPGSHDLARVYDEWGDQLESRARYQDAIDKYETVITTYPNATAEAQRAHNAEARVRFEYGSQLVAQGRYGAAIDQFEAIATNFADTAYAARAHAAAATAHYAWAQVDLKTDLCNYALPHYQLLASKYADTPEGAEAKVALAAPVDVAGELQGYPPSAPPTMYLSKYVDLTVYSFSNDYRAVLDGFGHFTFRQVQQGNYNLSEIRADGSQWYWKDRNSGNLYTISVGPLCTLVLGENYSYS